MSDHGFKFSYGDIVQIIGFGDKIFRINSIMKESYYEEGEEPYEEVVYQCININDELQIVDAYEEVLILVQTSATFALTQNPDPISSKGKKKEKKSKINEIDQLLDKINDYKLLHSHFGDSKYKTMITNTIKKLTEMTSVK